jgi:hypothetical protein
MADERVDRCMEVCPCGKERVKERTQDMGDGNQLSQILVIQEREGGFYH